MTISIVARQSPLSQIQVKEAMAKFPEISYQLNLLSSFGDKHQHISLLNGEAPADMFTRELDEAILDGKADIAVHSAKDLPYPLDPRIEVVALLPPTDQTDSLVSRAHLPLSLLPAGSTVGTSSPMRRRELLALRPDLKVVGIRGCIEERVRQVNEGEIDAAIVATCALKRLGLEREIAEVLPFQTHPLQGYLAITSLKGREDLRHLFEREDVLHRQGTVQLVGFGPGDPELLTVKALKALQAADVIFHDDLIDQEYLAGFRAEKVYVGKRQGQHHAEQRDINHRLLKAAREGRRVVRLKGGDPMVFAHGGEEIEFLRSNLVEVKVIPGVTAASALAAAAQVSLTHRGIASSVAFVNGHSDKPLVPGTETAIYYMGGTRLRQIRAALLEQGWPGGTPVLLAYNLTRPDEQIYDTTIDQMAGTAYPTPLLVLVGDVAALRTRSADKVTRTLYTGVQSPDPGYIHTPMIDIQPAAFTAPDTQRLNYILFTSRHAVRHWFGTQTLPDQAIVVSIGPATSQALRQEGVTQIEQVEQDDSYGVLDWFSRQERGSVLIPRSNLALPVIPDGLRKMGFEVQTLTVYNNVLPKHVRTVNLDNIQRVVFTSPSTIDNFLLTYGTLPSHIEYVTRGVVTEAHLQKILQTSS